VPDPLRALWDFDDLDASEERFRARLDGEPDPERRADVLTQLARVEGLRGRFDAADALLDEAKLLAGSRALVCLERGRVRRSGGDSAAALTLFVSAYDAALADKDWFTAADAAHMAALVDPDRIQAWTDRGMAIALREPDAAYWRGPLLNNLGWDLFSSGDYEGALDAFELALAAREEDREREYEREIARYAVAKALRMLGRAEEAVARLEEAVAWTNRAGRRDGWFHEELAEAYAAVGRSDEARKHAALAIPLLEAADPSFVERADRLRDLAGV
jgi:tetratricopeptide (TPR) repeat protein